MRFVKYLSNGSTHLGIRTDAGIVDTGMSDLRDYLQANEPEVQLVADLVATTTSFVNVTVGKCSVTSAKRKPDSGT